MHQKPSSIPVWDKADKLHKEESTEEKKRVSSKVRDVLVSNCTAMSVYNECDKTTKLWLNFEVMN